MKLDSGKAVRSILPHLDRLWATDIALTSLLVFLLIQIFVISPLRQSDAVRLLTNLFFSFILIASAITASRSRILKTFIVAWGVITFIFVWIWYLFPYQTLVFAGACVALVYLVLLAFLILAQALRQGPTTSHRIMGAVATYLLLGLIWSLIYYGIALLMPGAFKGVDILAGGSREVLRTDFQYFSFTVLTSVGFGDIVPVHPVARTAANLEGVAGQLFPAILIARLVSLQVQSKQEGGK